MLLYLDISFFVCKWFFTQLFLCANFLSWNTFSTCLGRYFGILFSVRVLFHGCLFHCTTVMFNVYGHLFLCVWVFRASFLLHLGCFLGIYIYLCLLFVSWAFISLLCGSFCGYHFLCTSAAYWLSFSLYFGRFLIHTRGSFLDTFFLCSSAVRAFFSLFSWVPFSL